MDSMRKKKCELCCGIARMYCESDQASLCWNCDVKVHGANFLVAKHTRCLLCSACQSPTPWKASGLRLGPTVSLCESCLARKNNSIAGRNQNQGQEINHCCGGDRLRKEDDEAESYNDDEDDEESDEDEEEEEVENQVVPAAGLQAPVVSSSSSSVSSTGDRDLVVKRTRRDFDLNCSDKEEIGDSNESRPLKCSERSTVMMNSMLRLHGGRKIRRL
ncbi:B-box domain protein 31 [Cardamine amara subsp. amara]|uniref:B-box domain protein 31 n=1 Tax=Cardamine amara subsp. amara TaxID=228776 RepID=A0ABD1AQN5_CARAN